MSLMVFHFLWGRNKHLTVSMVMNISSLKRHLISVFNYKAARSVAWHTLPYASIHSIPYVVPKCHAFVSKSSNG